MPTWPGDTPFEQSRVWTMGPDCPVNVGRFSQSVHAGTHADAPLHYSEGGRSIEAVELEVYLGPCRLIDLRSAGPRIEPADLAPWLADLPPRVLLRTYDVFPFDHWDSGFKSVAAASVALLSDHGVRLVGIDTASLDPESSKTMDAHRTVAERGMAILEGLVLSQPPSGDYELIALPLPLTGLDAAPVRAVLRELNR
jgi:arylformamidase